MLYEIITLLHFYYILISDLSYWFKDHKWTNETILFYVAYLFRIVNISEYELIL